MPDGKMVQTMKTRAAVVVPYYHSRLTELEKISFSSCLNVLGGYPVILVVPEKVWKEKALPGFTDKGYRHSDKKLLYETVPDEWMESISSYNKMMLSKEFYSRFLQYEYILIFQLDAFVFSDLLEQFCDYGYDYIGAPWLEGIKYLKNLEKGVWYVGNGGFSLRKVSSFLNILESGLIDCFDTQEDILWAQCASESFQVAPPEIALQFAFEKNVRQCYLKNGGRLPFGCHAWEKYDFDFWKPFFEKLGYFVTAQTPAGKDKEDVFDEKRMRYLEADRKYIRECLEKLTGRKRIWYVFGGGRKGGECIWMLCRAEIPNVRCVDNNEAAWGKKLWNVTIESPQILNNEKKDDICILIAVRNVKKEIFCQLELLGYIYGENILYYDDWVWEINNHAAG